MGSAYGVLTCGASDCNRDLYTPNSATAHGPRTARARATPHRCVSALLRGPSAPASPPQRGPSEGLHMVVARTYRALACPPNAGVKHAISGFTMNGCACLGDVSSRGGAGGQLGAASGRHRLGLSACMLCGVAGPLHSTPSDAGVLSQHGDYPLTRASRAACLLYTSPSPRDLSTSRMPSSA